MGACIINYITLQHLTPYAINCITQDVIKWINVQLAVMKS